MISLDVTVKVVTDYRIMSVCNLNLQRQCLLTVEEVKYSLVDVEVMVVTEVDCLTLLA
jgi:hypothetical protein